MTDSNQPTPRRDSEKSGFSRSTPVAASTDARSNGGSGVQRSHLRDRKTWLKKRSRAGRTWAIRKATSLTYCPAKRAA